MIKHNLNLSTSKATIGAEDVDFLGHTIVPAGIMLNPQQVEALMKTPRSKNKKHLQYESEGSKRVFPFRWSLVVKEILNNMANRIRPIISILK